MAVKPGYKQTEVGVIPEDWSTQTIVNASRKIQDYRGRTPKKLGMEWGGGDIPALSAGNVKMGFIDFDEECYLGSESLYKRWMVNGSIEKGDIVFTMEAPLGNAALIPDDRKYILSQRTVLLQPNPETTYSTFLYQVLISHAFQSQLIENATGSTALGIQRKKFEKLSVVCPPLAEQRTIAAALSDVDALLTKLDQLISKRRDLKQAAMQQLLTGQTRLPGFSGVWEVRTIEDCEKLGVIKLSRGNVISKKDIAMTPGDYPIYSSSVKNNGVFGVYGRFMFDEELITWSVDGGGDFFYRPKQRFSVTNVCGYMRVDTKLISYKYLSLQLQLLHGRMTFDYTTKAHPSVIRKAYAVPLPHIEEQTAIASVLSDMDADIAALETRRDKTRDLKQGMMQELLTGRIRII